jgi:hypothetical protein
VLLWCFGVIPSFRYVQGGVYRVLTSVLYRFQHLFHVVFSLPPLPSLQDEHAQALASLRDEASAERYESQRALQDAKDQAAAATRNHERLMDELRSKLAKEAEEAEESDEGEGGAGDGVLDVYDCSTHCLIKATKSRRRHGVAFATAVFADIAPKLNTRNVPSHGAVNREAKEETKTETKTEGAKKGKGGKIETGTVPAAPPTPSTAPRASMTVQVRNNLLTTLKLPLKTL